MPRTALLLVLAVVSGLTSACSSARPDRPDPAALVADAVRVERLRLALATAASAEARQQVAAAALAAGGATPLADLHPNDDEASPLPGFLLSGREMVGGFVPGRQPLLRSGLVVVSADLAGPDAAVVLEAGLLLVTASRTTLVPGRTVLVALWSQPVEDAVRGGLALPVWPADAVHGVVVVGGTGPLPDSLGSAPVHRVSPSGSLAVRATAVAHAVRAASVRPAAGDTLAPGPLALVQHVP